MDLSSAVATTGLSALATPTGTLTANDIRIGEVAGGVNYSDADVAYSMLAFFADAVSTFELFPYTGLTTGSTAWVAGTAQVETATAAGTITASGNATVTVTAYGMIGSPKAISVAVLNTDTASQWAEKVRTALAADVDLSYLFTVSGATTSIVLTRKNATYSSGGISIPFYVGNDATLNIGITNGSCTGITAAPTSADTTAGVATSGVKIYDGDGKDFEGVTLPTIVSLHGLMIKAVENGGDWSGTGISFRQSGGESVLFSVSDSEGDLNNIPSQLTCTNFQSPGFSYITVIGRTT